MDYIKINWRFRMQFLNVLVQKGFRGQSEFLFLETSWQKQFINCVINVIKKQWGLWLTMYHNFFILFWVRTWAQFSAFSVTQVFATQVCLPASKCEQGGMIWEIYHYDNPSDLISHAVFVWSMLQADFLCPHSFFYKLVSFLTNWF